MTTAELDELRTQVTALRLHCETLAQQADDLSAHLKESIDRMAELREEHSAIADQLRLVPEGDGAMLNLDTGEIVEASA